MAKNDLEIRTKSGKCIKAPSSDTCYFTGVKDKEQMGLNSISKINEYLKNNNSPNLMIISGKYVKVITRDSIEYIELKTEI